MTIATTSTTELNVDELITTSLQMIGFLNPGHQATSGDLDLGRRILGLGLQSLANTGVKLRMRDLLTLTLTPDVAYIDCPADTVSVERGGVIKNVDGLTEIPIEAIEIQRYQSMPVKTTSGMPTYYWPEQQSSGIWRIYFYPVTTSDWPTFIVPRVRKSRDVNAGNLTVDLDTRWHLAITKYLQATLARSKGRRDLATELMNEYENERTRAENNESERGNGMYTIQPTPWDNW